MKTPVEVATINIEALLAEDGAADAKRAIAQQIHEACRSSGFFYVSNHGVDVEKFQEVTDNFHRTMTDDEKWSNAINAYNKNNAHIRNGYYMSIPGKKAVESFCILNPNFTEAHPMIKAGIPLHEVNIWPDEAKHPEFRPFFERHFHNMCRLSSALLRGFALALGQPEEFFDEYFQERDTLSSISIIRYPYLEDYPPRKIGPDGVELSFEDHLDVSLITVLFQTPVPNLQVEMPGGWQDVPTSGDNFLINCGTYMAHITHNYFHAPNHRVKYINAERLSLPFFVNLGHNSTIQPFSPHDTGDETDERNPTVSYGQYLQKAFHALIAKNGQT